MGKNTEPSMTYDAASRKAFLLSVQHSKAIKKKHAIIKQEEELRESRRERRKAKKEIFHQMAQDLVEKQQSIGVKPLPLVKETAEFNIQVVEVDTTKKTNQKKTSVVNINETKE